VSKGMLIFIVVMGWTLLVHGGLTYLIVKKKEYSLISGFNNRPKEEQDYLIEKGYITTLGKIFTYSFYLLLLATLLSILRIPYGAEFGFGLFIVFLLSGLIYLQRFEVPHKRKRYLWIMGSISIVTVGVIVGALYTGSTENEVKVEANHLIVSGMYGVEWPIEEINNVELLEELPEVIMRENGFSSENVRKGKFRLEEPYGQGRLFIKGDEGPYLYINFGDDFVILNREHKEETISLYERLVNE
jgi:hypothetical protein